MAEHEKDLIFFLINFEGELGFDSDSAELGGPFLMLKNEEILQYYNLRYGAQSTRSYSFKARKGELVYTAEAFLLLIAVV